MAATSTGGTDTSVCTEQCEAVCDPLAATQTQPLPAGSQQQLLLHMQTLTAMATDGRGYATNEFIATLKDVIKEMQEFSRIPPSAQVDVVKGVECVLNAYNSSAALCCELGLLDKLTLVLPSISETVVFGEG